MGWAFDDVWTIFADATETIEEWFSQVKERETSNC